MDHVPPEAHTVFSTTQFDHSKTHGVDLPSRFGNASFDEREFDRARMRMIFIETVLFEWTWQKKDMIPVKGPL